MPHASSELLRFTFKYQNNSKTPDIPIRFIGENGKETQLFYAILDSGADEVSIPKKLADYLGQSLTPRKSKIHTAGGQVDAFSTKVHFFIGRGGREVEYKDIEACVIDRDMPVLVGIYPVFEDYDVTISASSTKVTMVPHK